MSRAAGSRAGGTSLLSISTAVLLVALTATQQHSLENRFVCPEKRSSDPARLQAMTRFMQDYARLDPAATVNDRLAFHDRLVRTKRCAIDGDTNQYSLPQS